MSISRASFANSFSISLHPCGSKTMKYRCGILMCHYIAIQAISWQTSCGHPYRAEGYVRAYIELIEVALCTGRGVRAFCKFGIRTSV